MAFIFQKALREKIWTKVLLTGPSGSGKTYSALRLASGIAKKMKSKIAYIDTENGRSKYYSEEFDFDILVLEPPYESQKYIDAIQAAIDMGYKIICADSLSHEWIWCNEMVNSMPGNSFTNWGKVKTLYHNKFMEFIIQSPAHIIATARGKDKWTTEIKNGKMSPQKIGEGSVQEDSVEYNYTCTFNLAQDTHIATCTKDNTHIFENKYDILKESDGEKLFDWANSGKIESSVPPKFATVTTDNETLEKIIEEVTNLFKEKIESGANKEEIYNKIEEICGMKNFKKIQELNMALKVKEAIMRF